MSELGDLLELVAGATERFRTLHGTARTWSHHGRQLELYRRATAAQARRGSVVWASAGGARETPETSEQRLHVWLALPDRMREEREGGSVDGPTALVRVGGRWWSRDPHLGLVSNEGDPDHGHGGMLDAALLAPVVLLPPLCLEVIGRRSVAGRDGIVVEAAPRDRAPILDAWAPYAFGAGHEELVVDAERGILLRREQRLDGEPLAVTEFEAVAFDQPLADDVFVLRPEAGDELRDVRQVFAGPDSRPLPEIAAAVPFDVYAALPPPPGWEVQASLLPAGGPWGGSAGPRVFVHYRSREGDVQLTVAQAGEPEPDDGLEWRDVRRAGVTLELRAEEPPAGAPGSGVPVVVRAERGGTYLVAYSSTMAADAVVEFVLGLAPVS